jgi:hypothetical protein|tara:strand:- start:1463 stop:1846 length:384 start_codon:yes stop_codon:yes gene_type:complete
MKKRNEYWVRSVLEENSNKNFVKRILDKDKYGSLQSPIDKKDKMTHLMSTAEQNGKHYVYPNVIQGKDGDLKMLSKKWNMGDGDADDKWESFNYAIENDEAIEFDNQEDAELFEKNWKTHWGEIFMY